MAHADLVGIKSTVITQITFERGIVKNRPTNVLLQKELKLCHQKERVCLTIQFSTFSDATTAA